jgi:hypothetical protein
MFMKTSISMILLLLLIYLYLIILTFFPSTGLLSKSSQSIEKEQWEDALKLLLQLQNTDNKLINYKANLDLSLVFRKLSKFQEAKQTAQVAISMDDRNPEGYRRWGQV